MRTLLDQIEVWLSDDKSVALATVIKTWGSSPQPVGAGMAVTGEGQIAGSVSGGCVEGAVIDASLEVIKTGKPIRLHFGVADSDAWEVGLACGGEIEVFVRVFTKTQLKLWMEVLNLEQVFCSTLLINGPDKSLGKELIVFDDGKYLGDELPAMKQQPIILAAKEAISSGKSSCRIVDEDQLEEFFFHVFLPMPRLIVVGGVHVAVPLVKLADMIGFEVIVIDPRRLFGTDERFPGIKQLLRAWPAEAFKKIHINPSTAIVMLTHDPKIDDPAIKVALSSPAFYIGALGSKKTHQKRLERLLADGVDRERLELIHAPVGLDLGGRSPEEIALSIMADVVKEWNSVGDKS